ncbi:hypothetical protein C2S53_013027 [Perilla frutescens var. hirtella]|uniref:Uncharacterized protein n=1 Tax=Perilla frutescens var. hirtella TaxID=608512 RepID=A0AAD4J471_PERFH|nr:hypothetical protein C2S53_013027 [Perilla frutescens var. hirtella]
MQEEHAYVAHQITAQQRQLAAHHEREAGAGQPDRRPEPVAVDHGVNQRSQQNRQNLERLREFQPQKRHEDQNRVVEQLEEGELPVSENGDERTERVEETRQVVDVRPEEHPAGGAGADGEAEEPLEGGGARPPPQPTRIADLGGGGEEDPGEYGGGDQRHREGVDGGNGAERNGAAVTGDEEDDGVEDDGGGDVDGDGGE